MAGGTRPSSSGAKRPRLQDAPMLLRPQGGSSGSQRRGGSGGSTGRRMSSTQRTGGSSGAGDGGMASTERNGGAFGIGNVRIPSTQRRGGSGGSTGGRMPSTPMSGGSSGSGDGRIPSTGSGRFDVASPHMIYQGLDNQHMDCTSLLNQFTPRMSTPMSMPMVGAHSQPIQYECPPVGIGGYSNVTITGSVPTTGSVPMIGGIHPQQVRVHPHIRSSPQQMPMGFDQHFGALGHACDDTGDETGCDEAGGSGVGGSGASNQPNIFVSGQLYYDTAMAQPVAFYGEGSQQNTDGLEGNGPAEAEVDRVYTLEEELRLWSYLLPQCFEYKGSGKGLSPRKDEKSRPLLTLADDGSFENKKAPGTVTKCLREVMEKAHKGYPFFSEDEVKNAWNMFSQTFRWDKNDEGAIRETYNRTAQKGFSRMVGNCKTFWLEYRRNTDYAKKHRTWATAEWLKTYIIYWREPEHLKRVDSSKKNQAKFEGVTWLGGCISTAVHRAEMAKVRRCKPKEVPFQEVWIKTHAVVDETTNVVKWGNRWAREVYFEYLRESIKECSVDMSQWKPLNKESWWKAVKGAKKNFVPGFSRCGDPEFMGFETRKHLKYPVMGQYRDQVEQQTMMIAHLVEENAVKDALLAKNTQDTANLKEMMKELFEAQGRPIPAKFAPMFEEEGEGEDDEDFEEEGEDEDNEDVSGIPEY